MSLTPIINSKLSQFKKKFDIAAPDDTAFEQFVNYHILSLHQPQIFSNNIDDLEDVTVGGGDDLGLDGIAFLANGHFVKSIEDVKDCIKRDNKCHFEFIFIQSKHREKFGYDEFSKFSNGVREFLSDKIKSPANNDVSRWHEIRNFIFSDEALSGWKDTPSVRLYYVVMGDWNNNEHILGCSEQLKNDLQNSGNYDDVQIHNIDGHTFNDIVNDNENEYSPVLPFVSSMSLLSVKDVDNSIVILCSANELVKILGTSENIIRKNLFKDNVRDFQGETTINKEILATIQENPENFLLLNNGITIVCDEVVSSNMQVKMMRPQIVNGCQTCSILYEAHLKKINLEKVSVIIKIVGTKNFEITNQIVKGTNRQNIVYDEAFEITRKFHKELEEFFNAQPVSDGYDKIYYERRVRQYAGNPAIKPGQKINFRILIQSFVSLFLFKPHEGHRHESKLLNDYRNIIFQDGQSYWPYYTAALLYSVVEKCFHNIPRPKFYLTYKSHIMLIFKESLKADDVHIDINDTKKIDAYCKDLIGILGNKKVVEEKFKNALVLFDAYVNDWKNLKGQNGFFSIKDRPEFTNLILEKIYKNESVKPDILYLRGKVSKIRQHLYGYYYGFIEHEPDDIYFNSAGNPHLTNFDFEDKDVLYRVRTLEDGRKEAVDIKVL